MSLFLTRFNKGESLFQFQKWTFKEPVGCRSNKDCTKQGNKNTHIIVIAYRNMK